MVFIYEENGVVKYMRDKRPAAVNVIVLDRMIPRPVKEGYEAVLRANFVTNEVWYDLQKLPPTFNELKEAKIAAIRAYDTSLNVNSFNLNGMTVWLDKATRVGLMNSTNIEKAAGHETTTLWLGTISLTINCDLAIQLLSQLELYALACYNKTAEHIANVTAMTTAEELEAYDYTLGYPAKLDLHTTVSDDNVVNGIDPNAEVAEAQKVAEAQTAMNVQPTVETTASTKRKKTSV